MTPTGTISSTPPTPPPPVGGSIGDLDVTTEQISATRARSLAPVTDAVRDASGAAALGYLVALVDVNTAIVGLCISQPDWTATADLMLHEAAPLVEGPTVLESNLTRAGHASSWSPSTSTTAPASPTSTSSPTRSRTLAWPPGS